MRLDPSIDRNVTDIFQARLQPRRGLHAPAVGLFNLETVCDLLAEKPELVIDSIRITRHAQSGERVEHTCGEAAESAITQTCIDFFVKERLQVDPVFRQKVSTMINNAEVEQVVLERTT